MPSRNAVNLIIDAINEGALPAPFQTEGAAGARLEVVFVDEAGGPTKMVTEFRNLVQRRHVDLWRILQHAGRKDHHEVHAQGRPVDLAQIADLCAYFTAQDVEVHGADGHADAGRGGDGPGLF